MSKILIITYDFVPFAESLGSASRMLELARFLKKSQKEIYVIAAKGNEEKYFGLESELESLETIYVKDKIKRVKKSSATKNKKGQSLTQSIWKILKQLSIPDPYIFTSFRMYRRAKSIIEDNNIEYVISSSPPHSIQLAGYFLKRKYKNRILWMVDYRDSWNLIGYFKNKFLILDFLSRKIEESILKKCDHFMYASPQMLEKINNNFLDISKKATLVLNGYSGEKESVAVESNRKTGDKIKIGYFGALMSEKGSYRDVSQLLRFIDLNQDLLEQFEWHFYGNIDIRNYSEIPNSVHIYKSVSQEESKSLMKTMDFLMILHSDIVNCDEVITGKFFEYLCARVPVVIFASPKMEAFRMTVKYNFGLTVNYESSKFESSFIEFINKASDFRLSSTFDITQFKREAQFKKLTNVLDLDT